MDSARSLVRALDGRPAAAVGRQARLDLTFEYRNGRTVLTDGYAEPPLRIGRSFDVLGNGGAAYLILVCTGPGVFAGDRLHQRVVVGTGARVMLASQSALQIHPADAPGPALVQHEYLVADDAELHCHWDPVVPFARARLVQRFDLQVAASSRVYWTDAFMSGRASRGETWQFDSIDHELRFAVAGSLVYLERYRLLPNERAPARRWMAGAADYVSTAIVHHEEATGEIAERIQRELDGIEGVGAGIDLIEERLLVARLLAEHGPAFARARAGLRTLLLDAVFQSPRLSMRR